MKKNIRFRFLTISLFLVTSLAIRAQYVLSTGNTFTINMGFNDLQYDGLEWTNTSSQTQVMHWEKIEVDTVPGSAFDMCASGQCYMGIPDSGAYTSFPSAPGQIGWFKCHFWTGSTSGTSKARVYIYETSAPNNGDTLTFILNINQANGINQNETNINLFNVYPNPVLNNLFFDFNNNKIDEIYYVTLNNAIGQAVYSYKLSSLNNSLDISNLLNGIYFVQITNNKKGIIQTKKIVVNH